MNGPSMLVLEEKSLLLAQDKTQQERQILVHTDKASYVEMLVEAMQCFLFETQPSIFLAKYRAEAKNSPVRSRLVAYLRLNFTAHILDVSLGQVLNVSMRFLFCSLTSFPAFVRHLMRNR